MGIEASGGVEIALARQIRLRIAIEYSRIALSFDETNSATAARDLDSSTKDIYGATDRSIGAAATVVAY